MIRSLLPSRRTGASVALALASLVAGGLTPREAHAGSWFCNVLDGPNTPTSSTHFPSPSFPSVTGPFPGASPSASMYGMGPISSVLWNNEAWVLYGADIPASGGFFVKVGADLGFPSSNPNWTFAEIDGPGLTNNVSVSNPASVVWGSNIWIAYTGGNGSDLFVGGPSGFGPGPGTQVPILQPNGCHVGAFDPQLVVFQNKLWVFYSVAIYEDGTCTTNHKEIHFSRHNGTSWEVTDAKLDGTASFPTYQATPVVFQNQLEVFYYSPNLGHIEVASTSGTTFTINTNFAGVGGTSPSLTPNVATLVDTVGTLHVFHYNQSSGAHTLKDGQQTTAGGGAVAIVSVDSTGDVVGKDSRSAPVLHGLGQVYYLDQSHNTVVGAWFDGSAWHPGVIDGGSSNLCNSQGGGGTSHALGLSITAVERSGGPHVFYPDQVTGDLREAYFF